MSKASSNRDLIMKYWYSWQKPDWPEMRSCLAPTVLFGGTELDSDAFVEMCGQGNPWKDVIMLSDFFTEKGGAILYEGTDTVTGQRIRVGEFITVRDNKITASIASFGSDQPPGMSGS